MLLPRRKNTSRSVFFFKNVDYNFKKLLLFKATKVFYVGNVLTNLLLVNKFLETDEYSVYGLGVLRDLLFGRSWMESGNFPRVTLVSG